MNQVYTHPGQPQMQAEVILASRGKNGAPPIYTLRLRYPRIIHAEVETHRVLYNQGTVVEVYEAGLGIMSDENLSRNARSSRAVPVKTMLNEVRNAPFVPWHWGANQRGMQAGEECNEIVSIAPAINNCSREEAWLFARDWAVLVANGFTEAGYHKQIANRLLEPFSWIDTLITATDWANFLWLRDHKDAEPHLQDLARLVKQALDSAVIQELKEGEWHQPYITDADRNFFSGNGMQDWFNAEVLCKISAARCARISYKPFDGDASYERELERYNSLVKSDRVHASPLEHQAKVDEYCTGQELGQFPPDPGWQSEDLRGNLAPGWIQFRKTVPNEAING